MNPLIVHYNDIKTANKDVLFNEKVFKLYTKFCPGPITFILKKKKSKIDSLTTANLNTVAIRFPNHKVIRSILKLLKFPLAMPSANISRNLSPTKALDVIDEFKDKIKIIIDGGKSKVGIESTVVDLTKQPKILRPGIISPSEIKKVLKTNFSNKGNKIKSPGMLKKHYSPGIPVIFRKKKPSNKNHAYIVFGKINKKAKNYFNLSKNGNLKEAAANLYKTMREIKKRGFKKIFISRIPNKGVGIAINDRLKGRLNNVFTNQKTDKNL